MKTCSWWIPKKTFDELQDFCKQYPKWEEACKDIELYSGNTTSFFSTKQNLSTEVVENRAIVLEYLHQYMDLVKRALYECDEDVQNYIFVEVTRGLNYNIMVKYFNNPHVKEYYMEQYRKFFWHLNKFRLESQN